MSHNNNVIDLQKHLKTKSTGVKESSMKTQGEVVDMTERRTEILNKERREVRRTILTEFVGAFVVLPERGLMKVALYDISENGVSFDVSKNEGHFQIDEEMAMRVYLNHKTYFSFSVVLKNGQQLDDEDLFRHGGQFVKGTVNDEALFHFVKFIETVSASLQTDHGDVMVSNLKN